MGWDAGALQSATIAAIAPRGPVRDPRAPALLGAAVT